MNCPATSAVNFGRLSERTTEIFAATGIACVWLCESPELWDAALARCAYVPVGYTRGMVAYLNAYFAPLAEEYVALDMVLLVDGQPIAVWPWSAARRKTGMVLTSLPGEPSLLPPLLVDGGQRIVKRVIQACIAAADAVATALALAEWRSSYSLSQGDLQQWHRKLIEDGATTTLGHEIWTDLRQPAPERRSAYRKSYKSLINQGRGLWRVHIDSTGDAGLFDQFRELHLQVAGRSTRSRESWDAQLSAIREGEGFVVYLFDHVEAMVGATLIHASRDEAMYAVGAYNRELFDQPVSHVSLSAAIDVAAERGCAQFLLGARPYAQEHPVPTEKELSIAYFKEGFATRLAPRLTLRHMLEQPIGTANTQE